MLQTPGLNTFYEDTLHFEGLNRAMFSMPGADLRFRLRRDAGWLVFTGTMRTGFGNGRFVFVPDSTFADSLSRRGVSGRPTIEQQFSLARHGVELSFVDELIRQGYSVPSVSQLVRAGMSGADADYLRAMGALGYRERTVDALVSLCNQGVDPAFITEANARAGRRLSAAELLRARSRGTFESAPAPAPAPPAKDSATAPAVDDPTVTGRWTLVPRPDGWFQLDIEWANVNQWRRMVRLSDLAGLSASDVEAAPRATFRIEQDAGGFTFDGAFQRGRGAGEFAFAPNGGFGATLRSLGVRDAGHVGVHQLKNLAFGFISASSVRDFMSSGVTPITLEGLVDLAVRQVSSGYVRDLRDSGIRGTESVSEIVELKFAGLPSQYAKDISALGYRGITSRQLLDLYRAAVTPEFIRQQQAAGRRDLTPEDLMDLRGPRRE
jgi:hypothetical protein